MGRQLPAEASGDILRSHHGIRPCDPQERAVTYFAAVMGCHFQLPFEDSSSTAS